jgi:hypothetical protein
MKNVIAATFWWGALAAIIVSFVNLLMQVAFGTPRDLASRAY